MYDPVEKFIKPLVEQHISNVIRDSMRNIRNIAGQSVQPVLGKRDSSGRSKTQTERTGKPRVAKGASWSTSSGKLKTSKKYVRGKKYKKTKSIGARGVHYRLEAGNEITPVRCGYVGHVTCPRNVVNVHMWRALLKALMLKKGYTIQSFNDLVSDGVPVGSTFVFQYRFNYDDASSITTTNEVVLVADTWEALALRLAALTFNRVDEFHMLNFSWIGSGVAADRVNYNLIGAKIEVDCKSTLKIQNRSVNAAAPEEDQADDVDNVPLYGKSYECQSAGFRYVVDRLGTQKKFVGNASNGLMELVVDTNDQSINPNAVFAEPPFPSFFVGIKKAGKVKLDPGNIKTSTLIWRKSYKLEKFFSYLSGAGTLTRVRGELGSCRLFALEKMLEVRTDSAVVPFPFTIAYEHDYKLGIIVKEGKSTISTMVIQDVNGIS